MTGLTVLLSNYGAIIQILVYYDTAVLTLFFWTVLLVPLAYTFVSTLNLCAQPMTHNSDLKGRALQNNQRSAHRRMLLAFGAREFESVLLKYSHYSSNKVILC